MSIRNLFLILLLPITLGGAKADVVFERSVDKASLNVKKCTTSDEQKLNSAFAYYETEVKKNSFRVCLTNAYLLWHQRHSDARILEHSTRRNKVTIRCADLSKAEANARTSRVLRRDSGEKGGMRMHIDFIRNESIERIASVIGHELSHNGGYRHPEDINHHEYSFTVPEQIEACILKGTPNAWKGPGKPSYEPSEIIGFATDGYGDATDDKGEQKFNFAWSIDGTVTAGSSEKIHLYRIAQHYKLAPGQTPLSVVGMAADGDTDTIYAYYDDGFFSAGSTTDLDSKQPLKPYSLPRPYRPSDIVGMAMDDSNNWVFAWYRDGKVSAGTTTNLSAHRAPYNYRLAPGYTPNDVIDFGIDGQNDLVLVWYKDGRVSAGNSAQLDANRAPAIVTTGR